MTVYVDRDSNNKVVGTYALEQYPGQEKTDRQDPQVLDHLGLSLEKRRSAKIRSLKEQARGLLSAEIGDLGDNITDALRCMVLGRAIQVGLVTDKKIVDRYDGYCAVLLFGYGGADAVMDVLEADAIAFDKHIVKKYYPAKEKAEKAKDLGELDAVGEI